MRRIGGTLLTVTGILACPCHLIITLPLLLSLLTGTALSNFLRHHPDLVYAGATIYFMVALALGAWFLLAPKRAHHEGHLVCPTCIPADAHQPEPWQSSPSEDRPITRR